jgi:hypothetical protein
LHRRISVLLLGDREITEKIKVDLSLFSTHRKMALASLQCMSAFKYCDCMKVLAASLRVGFCDEWKRAFTKQEIVINFLKH